MATVGDQPLWLRSWHYAVMAGVGRRLALGVGVGVEVEAQRAWELLVPWTHLEGRNQRG